MQRTAFTTLTTPTLATVQTMIKAAEDEIDKRLQTAWRLVKVTNEFGMITNEQADPWWTSPPYVQLKHVPVRSFPSFIIGATTYTSKLEVYNGGSYVDWAATKTEGRASDYYLTPENGRIHLARGFPWYIYDNGVRSTYYFGHSTVPTWVNELCCMMVAVQIMRLDHASMIAAGGVAELDVIGMGERVRSLESEIEKRVALNSRNRGPGFGIL
jgi:hypothetical protein